MVLIVINSGILQEMFYNVASWRETQTSTMGKGRKLFWSILVLTAVAAGTGLWFFNASAQQAKTTAAEPVKTSSPPGRVAGIGRIEPLDGTLIVSARSLSGQPSIVSELRVKEGDWVKSGEVIAVLDSHRQMEAAVQDLEARIAVAQQRVEAVKAGGKKSDTAAGMAEIARLEAVLGDARQDADRYDALYARGSATVSERNQRRVLVATTIEAINEQKARVAGTDEVREADVKLAQAEVESARASVARARAELESSIIRTPSPGRVLKVNAHKGEEVGSQGVVELGRTDRMYVVAEVFESDIDRVRVGQAATVVGGALKSPLHGKVESIGLKVGKDSLAQIDPVSLTDARVIEVKIRLDESEPAAGLIHGQVTATIGP